MTMPARNPSPAQAGPGPSSSASAAAAAAATATAVKPEIPWAFIDCPTDTLVVLISHMLDLLIQHNDQVELTPDALTRFHSRAAPGISVIEYLRRIVKYTNMEKIPLLSLLSYIDITCNHLPTFTLSSLTVHRFLIAGVCAGSKAQCDVFCTNSHYAKVGGIKVGELNALEREFLRVTKWNLCCNADLLQKYYSSLIKSHGGFTQAAEPTTPPFRAFPRSNSKPRTNTAPEAAFDGDTSAAGPSGTSGSADLPHAPASEADEAMRGEDDGMEQDDGPESAARGRSPGVVDDPLGVLSERRANTAETAPPPNEAMDVDPEPPDSSSAPSSGEQQFPTSETSGGQPSASGTASSSSALHTFPSRSSLRSDASSSVPSSSASSIRKASMGGSSTFTVKQGGTASPRLDTTSASATASTSSPSTSQAISIPSPVARNGSGGVHSGSGSAGRSFGNGNSNGTSRSVYSTSPETTTRTASGDSHTSQPHHAAPHGGKLLKNLVGGIFGKRTHSHPPPSSVGSGSAQASANASAGPSRTGSIPPPSQAVSNPANAPIQRAPASTAATAADRVLSPRPGERSASHARERERNTASPHMSPGLARPVTPRIRTRDELSADGLTG